MKSNLDQHTVYELIQGHGRTDMYLYFATAVGDYERVVEHHILEEEWTKAMNVIVRQVRAISFAAESNNLIPRSLCRQIWRCITDLPPC